MARVHAVCVSTKKGEKKAPVESILLVADSGVAGDAHAGGERQVSLLDLGSMETAREKLATIAPGAFAENINVEGLSALALGVGHKLRVGRDAVLEISHIGKTCHKGCEIRRIVGDCIMPREGLFARVLAGGAVRAGDAVEVVEG